MIKSNSPFEKGFIKDPTQLALQPNNHFCPRITEVITILVSYTTHQPLFLSGKEIIIPKFISESHKDYGTPFDCCVFPKNILTCGL